MLFKILHGDASRISTDITPYHEGYCYVTYDGYFYIDMNNERVKLNSHNAETLTGKSLEEIQKSINYNDLKNKPNIPTKTSELTNDSGYITSAPVSSVNNKTGAVSLSASDVGAVPTARTVNGKALSSNISLSASDVGALPDTTTIPTKLSDLTADSTHRVVTDTEKSTWNAKANISDIPTKVGDLTNDKGYITSYTETDPTVPAWAKASTKPSYTNSEVGLGNVDNVKQYSASNPPPYPVTSVNNKTGAITLSATDVGADASGTASSAVSTHNTNTSAHADIRQQISQLSSEIVDLSKDSIPDYWLSELETKADTIRQTMETAGSQKSAFLWYTDAHWPSNSKMSPKLLKYLAKNTSMNKVNFGGDIIGDPSPHNYANTKYVYEWREMISDLPNHHSVFGNHDVAHRSAANGDINVIGAMAYAQLIAPEESADMVVGGDSYYYIDNLSEKTRYLYLSYLKTGMNSMIESEAKFIVDAISSAPEGWHIVAICHRWWGYTAASTPTIGSVSAFEAEVLEIFDAYNARTTRSATSFFQAVNFANAKGKVEFCIGGHIHVDYDFASNGGIPVIITTADANQNRVPDSEVDSGKLGTITESAVFGIIADYTDAENTKITVVGVGRGTSRVVRQAAIIPISITNITYSGDTTVGGAIDKSKFSFTVNYSNGTSETVIGATSVSRATIGAGDNSVEITYTEGSVTVSGTLNIVGTEKPTVNLFNADDPDVTLRGRINSSGQAVAYTDGQLVTGFIDAKVGDVFTVTSDKSADTNSYTGAVRCYTADKDALEGNIYSQTAPWSWSDDGKQGTLTVPSTYGGNDYSATGFVRFCIAYTDINSIVITKA